MRNAARVDTNQAEIVDALRKQETSFVECKSIRPTSEGGSNGLTKAQTEFIARWPGKIHVVRSKEEAITAILGKEVLA